MSKNQTPRRFAFGRNQCDGCLCPAMAAGMKPDGTGSNHVDGLLEAAEFYDGIVASGNRGHEGTISEEFAKDSWIAMMESVETKRNKDILEAAEAVAEYHDWI